MDQFAFLASSASFFVRGLNPSMFQKNSLQQQVCQKEFYPSVFVFGITSEIKCSRAVETQAEPEITKKPRDDTLPNVFVEDGFFSAVSGEWFGYECFFSRQDGSPLSIEERYVPDEYREWGVTIRGFESLTSMNITGRNLLIKKTRVLPSVGCEADAVVPEVSDSVISEFGADPSAVGFEEGSFVIGPISLGESGQHPWQFCLVDASDSSNAGSPRARVLMDIENMLQERGKITVRLEAWEAPFCDGTVLPGCGGTSASFADDPALKPDIDLAGQWTRHSIVWAKEDQSWKRKEFEDSIKRNPGSNDHCTIVMPRGLSLNLETRNDGISINVGWLQGDDRILLSQCYGNNGDLVKVSRTTETRLIRTSF